MNDGRFLLEGLPPVDAMGRPRRYQDPAPRLRRMLRVDGDCLVFTGACNSSGYGRVSVAGSPVLAHRLAWMIAHQRLVPDGMYVLHSCDNPPCCNPDHLRAGTAAENSADMVERERQVALSGASNPRTKYNDATVEMVRSLTAQGLSTLEITKATGVPPDYVRKLARGNRRGASAPGPIDQPRQPRRRLPYEQIAAEYERGATTTELAEKYCTHAGNVSRILRACGVAIRPRHANPAEAYQRGWLLRAGS